MSLKEENKYKVPENHLLIAICWFHLNNFHLAASELKESERNSHPADSVHRASIIWKSLVEKNLGNRVLSQGTLLKYIESYPHSSEADLINGRRAPASVKSEADEKSEAHSEKKGAHHE